MQTIKYIGETLVCTLKENSILIDDRREKFSIWGFETYNFKKEFLLQDIDSVTFKKDYLHHPNQEFQFVHSMTIKFKGEKTKVVIADVEVQINYSKLKTFTWVRNLYYQDFIALFIEKISKFSHIRIYAYEGARSKIFSKMLGFLPSFVVGKAVIGGAFILKLLTIIFKTSLKFTFLFWLNSTFFDIGFVLTLSFFAITYWIDHKNKAQALLESVEQLPPQFVPQKDKQKFLESENIDTKEGR
jgi:hypothetical protein